MSTNAAKTSPQKQSSTLGAFRSFSSMLSRMNLASLFTSGHEGSRDYYTVFGYKKELMYNDLLVKYQRQGIASRIVEAPAQAIWDNPPNITSNDPKWDEAWQRLITKNGLWEALYRTDKLCGLGRYSCLFIGTNGQWKPGEAPVAAPNRDLAEVIYFQAYSQNTADIQSLESDPTSAQYMMPKLYTLYPFKQDTQTIPIKLPTGSPPAIIAHHSRILHVAENTLENSILGQPRLERVFNDLDDLLKVAGGTSETYWLTSNRGMQVDVDKDMDLSAEDATDLSDEINEYHHQLRRFIRTKGVKINNLGSEVPDPKNTFEMLVALISGATGIPRRILIGSEAGQLASDQDRANWADRIQSRRKHFVEPTVLYPLIALLTNLRVLPSSPSLTITIDWPEAFILSPLERAQEAAQHARSATNFAKAIDTMAKMKAGKPGTPAKQDSEGKDIPGTAVEGVAGIEMDDLVTVEEARKLMGLDKPQPQLNDPADLPGT